MLFIVIVVSPNMVMFSESVYLAVWKRGSDEEIINKKNYKQGKSN